MAARASRQASQKASPQAARPASGPTGFTFRPASWRVRPCLPSLRDPAVTSSPSSAQPKLWFAYAGDIDTPTGGYGYDRKIIAGLRDLGWSVELLPLGDDYPFPAGPVLEEAVRRLSGLPNGARVVVDGLAYARLAAAAGRLAARLDLTALVHHPLCLEHGLTPAEADLLKTEEGEALAHAARVIVTSPATAELVTTLFGIAPERIGVVEPGTDPATPAAGSGGPGVSLLSVGSVLPRKGHDLVIEALARLDRRDWTLTIAGGLRDTACAEALRAQIAARGLTDQVRVAGAMDSATLEAAYARADLFVLASRYEGFGMAFAEALAHGLPVIGSGGDAVRKTFSLGGALYIEPDDVESLAAALNHLLSDPAARSALRNDALAAAKLLPDWSGAAQSFADYVISRR
ncbi:glycosyltransferase [Microvirga tunisiensis]|uniref:Glycosyltransferase n=1 Tax=Pannonibacter tanglangensis TaxID=2750084 RepID=A0A7X5F485_9HYPH|nr:glycosyltransferase family 4 protein [Pannonibacter sp. XCT-53]NBN79481.1 glycosyltransferase [Pannonibacter sp. XCT-53]